MRIGTRALLTLAVLLGGCGDINPPDEVITVGRPTPDPVLMLAASAPATVPSTTTTHPPSTTTTAAPTTTTTTQAPTTTVPPTTTTTVAPEPVVVVVPTTVAPAPSPGDGCAGWRDVVAQHFPGEEVPRACRVMMCESGGNPNAKNPRSTASGLFQFLDGTWRSTTGLAPPARAYPPDVQIKAAHTLWSQQGWRPWVCG